MAPRSAQQPPKPTSRPSSLKTRYLILYNFVNAVLWTTVFGRTALTAYLRSPALVHISVSTFARWTQTLAGLEVLHAALGIVRAPVATTFIQVFSRFLLMWGITYPFPWLAQSPFYTSMLLAWSLTEVIRYSFFALSLCGVQSNILTWLRYSTFTVLYPVGIVSELVLIFGALAPARDVHRQLFLVLWAVVLLYFPASYIMYTHMLKQRRKVLGKLQKAE